MSSQEARAWRRSGFHILLISYELGWFVEACFGLFQGKLRRRNEWLYISVQLLLCLPVSASLSKAKTNLPYMTTGFCFQEWKQLTGCTHHILVGSTEALLSELRHRHWNSVWAHPVQGSSDDKSSLVDIILSTCVLSICWYSISEP